MKSSCQGSDNPYHRLRILLKKELSNRLEARQKYCWAAQARPEQLLPDGHWKIWLIMAGRGFGKTRTGAESVKQWVQQGYRRLCLLGETIHDVRHVMVEGESGLLSLYPPKDRPLFEPSKREITWQNGAKAFLFSAENYEQLRGPQFDGAWVDELGKFHHQEASWDQLMMGLRLGKDPRVIVTTTPRPTPFLKKLIHEKDLVLTQGSTFQNKANLPSSFLNLMERRYGPTPLGSQELQGLLVDNLENALWHTQDILYSPTLPSAMERIVVAIDPAVTHHKKSDETGIVVAGKGEDGLFYVLEDGSGHFSSNQWIERSLALLKAHQGDLILAEVNNGGDLVESLLRAISPHTPYKSVRATRGKYLRAEPISALYRQKKVYHACPFPHLERQMLAYHPNHYKGSPDRLDALVWALTELAFCDQTSHCRVLSLDL